MAKAHDAIMGSDPAPRLSRAPSPSSLKAFHFPKQQFGSKGEERSFRAEWCDAPGSGSSTVHSLLSTKATYILNYGVEEPRL